MKPALHALYVVCLILGGTVLPANANGICFATLDEVRLHDWSDGGEYLA